MQISKEKLKADADALRKRAAPIWEALEGPERDQHKRAFESSLKHFEEQRLCIAVMGEFNTGKSTLLNTFIGEELLGTDQLECTAVPTWVRWTDGEDEQRQATVIYADGKSKSMPWAEARAYTTLDRDTWEQIERVEITLPQPADGEGRPTGLVLVDTPGLNGNPQLEARSIHQLGMSHVTIVVVPADGIGRKTDADLIKNALKIADRVHTSQDERGEWWGLALFNADEEEWEKLSYARSLRGLLNGKHIRRFERFHASTEERVVIAVWRSLA